jgi:hypothetical protein
MIFHVTSFFVFGAKYLFGCPSVTYLSVLHDRGVVGTDWPRVGTAILFSSACFKPLFFIIR